MRERPARAVRPPELTAFLLSDWLDHGVDERDDGRRELDEVQHDADWAVTVVAAAYRRYRAARTAWVEVHGTDRLEDLMDLRRRRPAEWAAAEFEAQSVRRQP
jgi:membrane-bound lytic murein transglycosylase B